MKKTALALSLVFGALATPLRGQDIGEQLRILGEANARGYVGPLARGLGHALTAGFVSSADPHGMLGFSVGIRGVGALFTDDDETFQVIAPSSVTYTSPNPLIGTRTYNNPYSVTNNGRSTTVNSDGARAKLVPAGEYRNALTLAGQNPDAEPYTITLLEGKDFPAAPFAAIDASLGIGFGTQVMARVFPTIDVGSKVGVDDIGDISAFGIGVMHNLTQYLPMPTPMWDVSVVLGMQKLNAGDYLEAKGSTIGIVASAGVGPLSAYAHASSYKADMDVSYDYTPPNTTTPVHIAFTESVDRTQRLAVGAQLDLVVLKLTAEYGMGDMKTVSAGASFGLH